MADHEAGSLASEVMGQHYSSADGSAARVDKIHVKLDSTTITGSVAVTGEMVNIADAHFGISLHHKTSKLHHISKDDALAFITEINATSAPAP